MMLGVFGKGSEGACACGCALGGGGEDVRRRRLKSR